jgi:hypothetical protein
MLQNIADLWHGSLHVQLVNYSVWVGLQFTFAVVGVLNIEVAFGWLEGMEFYSMNRLTCMIGFTLAQSLCELCWTNRYECNMIGHGLLTIQSPTVTWAAIQNYWRPFTVFQSSDLVHFLNLARQSICLTGVSAFAVFWPVLAKFV